MLSAMLKFGFLLLFFISPIICMSNTTFESMKLGISAFNAAGNNFFNLIRGKIDPSLINIENFKDFEISFTSINRVVSAYLSHSILLAVGISFAVFLPIIGAFFCICRCCGRCGGKVKPMDPKNVRCKKIFYGLILVTLAVGKMFAVIITLFNNEIVHESIINPDPSINIFMNMKSQCDKSKSALQTMKLAIQQSEPSQIDNMHMQPLTRNLEGAIGTFYSNFINLPDVFNVIEQSKSIAQVINQIENDKYMMYLKNISQLLKNLNSTLHNTKQDIERKLSGCTDPRCPNAMQKTTSLFIPLIEDNKINNITEVLNYLSSADFKEKMNKMINVKDNNSVDTKLILDREINNIKNMINDKSFPNSLKDWFLNLIDNIIIMRNELSSIIPMPLALTNESTQNSYYRAIKNVELYRYYIYIGLALSIILIIIFYFLGLLYGNCGERPEEDAGCFNRGVGANFLMISVTLTFLFSSLVMIVVLTNLMTTSIIQTDFCRYAVAPNEHDSTEAFTLIDKYMELVLKASTNMKYSINGTTEGLLRNCEKQNFYMAFSKLTQPHLLEMFKSELLKTEDKLISQLADHLSLSKYLNTDPFIGVSSIDYDRLVDSISLSIRNNELRQYLSDLAELPLDMKDEILSLNALVVNVTSVKSYIKLILEHLVNIQNQYMKWRSFARVFEGTKISLIKSQSSGIMKSFETNLVPILNLLFGTMFENVSCSQLRSNIMELIKVTCHNIIDSVNGCWYGLGLYLLFVIPGLIFACLLVSLYRRIQKFYPDKDEPDYENYLGFYARADNEALKSTTTQSKAPHRGYKPIPLQ